MWLIAALAAGITAFYMFRLVSLTFLGKERFDHHHVHPHEAPKTMLIPLLILAVFSVIGGYVGIPHVLGGHNYFEEFLAPVFAGANAKMLLPVHDGAALELGLMAISVALGLLGIYAGWKIFTQKPDVANAAAKRFSGIHTLLWNKYFVDEVYDAVIVNPIKQTSDKFLWKIFDVKIIDNSLNFSAQTVNAASNLFRKMQSGIVQNYAIFFVAGILFVLGYLMIR